MAYGRVRGVGCCSGRRAGEGAKSGRTSKEIFSHCLHRIQSCESRKYFLTTLFQPRGENAPFCSRRHETSLRHWVAEVESNRTVMPMLNDFFKVIRRCLSVDGICTFCDNYSEHFYSARVDYIGLELINFSDSPYPTYRRIRKLWRQHDWFPGEGVELTSEFLFPVGRNIAYTTWENATKYRFRWNSWNIMTMILICCMHYVLRTNKGHKYNHINLYQVTDSLVFSIFLSVQPYM